MPGGIQPSLIGQVVQVVAGEVEVFRGNQGRGRERQAPFIGARQQRPVQSHGIGIAVVAGSVVVLEQGGLHGELQLERRESGVLEIERLTVVLQVVAHEKPQAIAGAQQIAFNRADIPDPFAALAADAEAGHGRPLIVSGDLDDEGGIGLPFHLDEGVGQELFGAQVFLVLAQQIRSDDISLFKKQPVPQGRFLGVDVELVAQVVQILFRVAVGVGPVEGVLDVEQDGSHLARKVVGKIANPRETGLRHEEADIPRVAPRQSA